MQFEGATCTIFSVAEPLIFFFFRTWYGSATKNEWLEAELGAHYSPNLAIIFMSLHETSFDGNLCEKSGSCLLCIVTSLLSTHMLGHTIQIDEFGYHNAKWSDCAAFCMEMFSLSQPIGLMFRALLIWNCMFLSNFPLWFWTYGLKLKEEAMNVFLCLSDPFMFMNLLWFGRYCHFLTLLTSVIDCDKFLTVITFDGMHSIERAQCELTPNRVLTFTSSTVDTSLHLLMGHCVSAAAQRLLIDGTLLKSVIFWTQVMLWLMLLWTLVQLWGLFLHHELERSEGAMLRFDFVSSIPVPYLYSLQGHMRRVPQ